MPRQFVKVRFKEGTPTYTYHHDGAPLAVGDAVEVDARGTVKKVTVVGFEDAAPRFPTKPILRVVPPKGDELVEQGSA